MYNILNELGSDFLLNTLNRKPNCNDIKYFKNIVQKYRATELVIKVKRSNKNIGIMTLLNVNINEKIEKNFCSICFEKNSKLFSAQLLCNHIFHIKCIKNWRRRQNSCPTCRKPLENVQKVKSRRVY